MYAKITDGAVAKYPYTFSDLRRDNPGVSFPRAGMETVSLEEYDVVEVAPADKPAATPFTTVTEGTPELVQDVWTQTWVVEAISSDAGASKVNAERDRRVAIGFTFNGKIFDSRVQDQKRIAGAGALAVAAIMTGALPGDLRWHEGDADFVWIAQDNSLVTMDAHTMLAFGKTAARWESLHVFAARALKDTPGGIPDDFTDDRHWP